MKTNNCGPTKLNNPSLVSDLVNHIRSQGWKIIPAKEAFDDPISIEVPDGFFNGNGCVAAIAKKQRLSSTGS